MANRKPHLNFSKFFSSEDFRPRNNPRSTPVPLRERQAHGRSLYNQYLQLLERYDENLHRIDNHISEEVGIYIEITSFPGEQLTLDSLDTKREFKLRAVRQIDDNRQCATVFIPESKRTVFLKKITRYLDPTFDSKSDKPAHHSLLGSISEVKLASLRSFWTDAENKFPSDPDQKAWWELWLKGNTPEETTHIANTLSKRLKAPLSRSAQHFFGTSVFLIQASVNELEYAPLLISNLEEVRKAKETPIGLLEESPKDQQEWVNLLRDRLAPPTANSAICILDAGINYTHSLLQYGASAENAECWDPNWPHFDQYGQHHGSLQAGLALFGDFQEALTGNQTINLTHIVESARILPPRGNNEPELYGAITVGTAAKIEINNPTIPRVYSLAVTTEPEDISGQPSSWSSEIDLFSSGMMDNIQRLFVISAGNISEMTAYPDYWDQIHLHEIEDPAQSWNALTVGAYTERVTNDDPSLTGWEPVAGAGDASPHTRSSVNWGWKKQSPFKPDVVAEGGNRLLSSNRDCVSNDDVVSLLTTSGNSAGALFETSYGTSAATALVSRQAAILMAEYPNYWPETIRALIVHAAEWTPRMWERFGLLQASHTRQVANETMLRTVGYGVSSLEKAKHSADNALTLIAENTITPFTKSPESGASSDPKLCEMQLYEIPWPIEVLQQLPPELEVRLKVTLSYFIEPNPGRRGYKQRFSYQSHGLRFEVIRPTQSLNNFRQFVNGRAERDGYTRPEGNNIGWQLGPKLRTRGSLHSDVWTGDAQSLADMNKIAVYPVGGWWKYRTAEDRWTNDVRYSLIVSIEVPDSEVDIYSLVENMIETEVEIQV